ncbi:MAG: HTTM domain-containing protein [Pirellulales bacterium]
MTALTSTLKRLVEIDVRSLAALRILLGLLIAYDVAVRAADFELFYSDAGLVSIAAARRLAPSPAAWSLFWLHSSDAFQWFLLAATAASGIWLALGWRTRWASVAAWVLVTSLWNRNPLVGNYGDSLLRMLLFWGLFLPWGSAWSLDWIRDLRRGRVDGRARAVCSWASAAILLQLTLVYLFGGLYKWNDDWLHGQALYHALHLEYAARPAARWFVAHEWLLPPLTQATLALELLGPLAMWSPWRTTACRLFALACFLALHVGIELFFSPVYLSYVCAFAWACFLPTSFWESSPLRATLGRLERRLVQRFGRVSPALSSTGCRIAAANGAWRTERLVMGQTQFVNGLCGFFLLYVVLWNVATFDSRLHGFLPPPLRPLGRCMMLWQTWDMFYIPGRHNGWFSVPARLRSGAQVDALWNGRPVDRRYPAPSWDQIRNTRWRVFFYRLGAEQLTWLHPRLAEYLLESWNRSHFGDQQALEVDVVYTHRVGRDERHQDGFASRVVATARVPSPVNTQSPDGGGALERLFQERDLFESP